VPVSASADVRSPVAPADESTESERVEEAPVVAIRQRRSMSFGPAGDLPFAPYAATRVSPPCVVVSEGAVSVVVLAVVTAPLVTSTGAVGSMPLYAEMPPAPFAEDPNVQLQADGSEEPATLM
jgi:hypothetical protein